MLQRIEGRERSREDEVSTETCLLSTGSSVFCRRKEITTTRKAMAAEKARLAAAAEKVSSLPSVHSRHKADPYQSLDERKASSAAQEEARPVEEFVCSYCSLSIVLTALHRGQRISGQRSTLFIDPGVVFFNSLRLVLDSRCCSFASSRSLAAPGHDPSCKLVLALVISMQNIVDHL